MRDAITKFVLSMIMGCIIFGIAIATMYATRVAPAGSFIEIFWGLTTAVLWILSFVVIITGISNLLNDINYDKGRVDTVFERESKSKIKSLSAFY